MFKCKWLIFFSLALSSCATGGSGSSEFLGVEKACGENQKLVFKLMKFSEKDFVFQKSLGRGFGSYEIRDLKPGLLKKEGLDWLQLRFEKGRLQALWFGPRKSLESDMARIGLKPSLLRNKKGEEMEEPTGGDYYVKDVDGRKVRIEHEGRPQKGTTVTCFPVKKRR